MKKMQITGELMPNFFSVLDFFFKPRVALKLFSFYYFSLSKPYIMLIVGGWR